MIKLYKALSVLLCLAVLTTPFMAGASATIALDNSANGFVDTGTTNTFALTVSGSNRDLVVACEVQAGQTLTGITYAGVSMSQINTQALGGATFDNVYLYNLVAPTTGTNNIIATISGSAAIYCAAESFTGVNQSNPLDVNGVAATTGTSVTKSLTTTVDNDWLVAFFSVGANTDGVGPTAGAGTTIRQTNVSGWYAIGDSNGAKTPTGSYSLTGNYTVSRLLGINIVALQPLSSAAPTSSFGILTFFGWF